MLGAFLTVYFGAVSMLEQGSSTFIFLQEKLVQ
jgi:hypothetical protein